MAKSEAADFTWRTNAPWLGVRKSGGSFTVELRFYHFIVNTRPQAKVEVDVPGLAPAFLDVSVDVKRNSSIFAKSLCK